MSRVKRNIILLGILILNEIHFFFSHTHTQTTHLKDEDVLNKQKVLPYVTEFFFILKVLRKGNVIKYLNLERKIFIDSLYSELRGLLD